MPSSKCLQITAILLLTVGLVVLVVTLSGQKPLATFVDNLIKKVSTSLSNLQKITLENGIYD